LFNHQTPVGNSLIDLVFYNVSSVCYHLNWKFIFRCIHIKMKILLIWGYRTKLQLYNFLNCLQWLLI